MQRLQIKAHLPGRRHTFLDASKVGAYLLRCIEGRAAQKSADQPKCDRVCCSLGLVAPATGKSLSDASVPDASALTEPVPLGGDAVKLSEKWRWPWEQEQPAQQQAQQGLSKSEEGGARLRTERA